MLPRDLPITAPKARDGSPTRIACPGIADVVRRSPSSMDPESASTLHQTLPVRATGRRSPLSCRSRISAGRYSAPPETTPATRRSYGRSLTRTSSAPVMTTTLPGSALRSPTVPNCSARSARQEDVAVDEQVAGDLYVTFEVAGVPGLAVLVGEDRRGPGCWVVVERRDAGHVFESCFGMQCFAGLAGCHDTFAARACREDCCPRARYSFSDRCITHDSCTPVGTHRTPVYPDPLLALTDDSGVFAAVSVDSLVLRTGSGDAFRTERRAFDAVPGGAGAQDSGPGPGGVSGLGGVTHHADAAIDAGRLAIDADPFRTLADDSRVVVTVAIDTLEIDAGPHDALRSVRPTLNTMPVLGVAKHRQSPAGSVLEASTAGIIDLAETGAIGADIEVPLDRSCPGHKLEPCRACFGVLSRYVCLSSRRICSASVSGIRVILLSGSGWAGSSPGESPTL